MLIDTEDWSRTNADNLKFFDKLKIDSDPEYITKALLLIHSQFPEVLKKTGATNKSNTKSADARGKANELFKKKKWIEALKNYSKSIALAENGSTELGFAYANRSALLLHRGFYKECLEDIDRALDQDYPENKKSQLIIRRDKAEKLVSTQNKGITQDVLPPLPSKNETLRGATQAIKLAKDQKYGRFIQATRDIAPGEILLIENPYAIVMEQDYKTTHCGDCSNMCFNPIPCSNCSVELYCTEKCREKAYKEYHQYECVILNHYPAEIFKTADKPKEKRYISMMNKEYLRQLALRITLKGFRTYQGSVTEETEEDLYEHIGQLKTHKDDLSKSALMVLAFNLAKQFEILKKHTNFMSKLQFNDKEDILKYHLLRNRLICCFNVATLRYRLDQQVNGKSACMTAIGLYLTYSMFNHSCAENAGYGYYGRTIVVRAIRKIEKGEQCFINYRIFFHEQHKIERNFLSTRCYLFTCKCIACVKDWETYDQMMDEGMIDLNSRTLESLQEIRTVIEMQKNIDERSRQRSFGDCAQIENMINKDRPTINLVRLYNVLNLIILLRYQGLDF